MREAAKHRRQLAAFLLVMIPPVGMYFAIGAGATGLAFVGLILILVGMIASMFST